VVFSAFVRKYQHLPRKKGGATDEVCASLHQMVPSMPLEGMTLAKGALHNDEIT
jgi:hypothetical protein